VHVLGNPERVIWDQWDPEQLRYSYPLIWQETNRMIAVPVARNPEIPQSARDWVVVVDSNIPLEQFEFVDRLGFDKVVARIKMGAEKLWQLEELVRADGKRLSREMEEAA
jgi:CRISPR/Cas system-associated protein Csm6